MIQRIWKSIKYYIGVEDYIAVTLILLGIIGYFESLHNSDFYIDIRSELIGIGITVLIIDNVNEIYRRRAEKERLILQMGSPDNHIASEATRQMRIKGWLVDGSLKGAHLSEANLQGVNLGDAVLADAKLVHSKLSNCLLYGANLSGAFLHKSDLSGSSLCYANLTGAYLTPRTDQLLRNNPFKDELMRFIFPKIVENDIVFKQIYMRGAEIDANNQYPGFALRSLPEADLSNARLQKANLTGAVVTNEQLAKAETLSGATMPDGKKYDPNIHTEIARLRKEAGLDL